MKVLICYKALYIFISNCNHDHITKKKCMH